MMNDLKITTAQFEKRSGGKAYNCAAIDELSKKAKEQDPLEEACNPGKDMRNADLNHKLNRLRDQATCG